MHTMTLYHRNLSVNNYVGVATYVESSTSARFTSRFCIRVRVRECIMATTSAVGRMLEKVVFITGAAQGIGKATALVSKCYM